jgi:hypothetical protein
MKSRIGYFGIGKERLDLLALLLALIRKSLIINGAGEGNRTLVSAELHVVGR